MKNHLFIMRTLPHGKVYLQETLDVILTIAAFDQKVSLLFLDQGVFQLKSDQRPEALDLKDTAAIFNALDIYDIHDLYVEIESLQQWGLKPSDLFLPVKEIYRKDVNQLMHASDIIMGG